MYWQIYYSPLPSSLHLSQCDRSSIANLMPSAIARLAIAYYTIRYWFIGVVFPYLKSITRIPPTSCGHGLQGTISGSSYILLIRVTCQHSHYTHSKKRNFTVSQLTDWRVGVSSHVTHQQNLMKAYELHNSVFTHQCSVSHCSRLPSVWLHRHTHSHLRRRMSLVYSWCESRWR